MFCVFSFAYVGYAWARVLDHIFILSYIQTTHYSIRRSVVKYKKLETQSRKQINTFFMYFFYKFFFFSSRSHRESYRFCFKAFCFRLISSCMAMLYILLLYFYGFFFLLLSNEGFFFRFLLLRVGSDYIWIKTILYMTALILHASHIFISAIHKCNIIVLIYNFWSVLHG